jgi:hypothetical protein
MYLAVGYRKSTAIVVLVRTGQRLRNKGTLLSLVTFLVVDMP